MLKDNSLHSDFIIYANQVAPIVETIVTKFEQMTFITLIKEFITLEKSIEKFNLIDEISIVEALTRDLRKSILDFRANEYKNLSDTSSNYGSQLERIIINSSTYYDQQILNKHKERSTMVFPGFRFERID